MPACESATTPTDSFRSDDGWQLRRAADADIDALMRWFPTKDDTQQWGGPRFRFPFDKVSFREDCRWDEIDSWLLEDPDGGRAGFGQYYALNGHINLARVAVHPERRAAGAGRRLMLLLMQAGAESLDLPAYSLFVYQNNQPAVALYRALGFEVAAYPADVEAIADCWFMTRPR